MRTAGDPVLRGHARGVVQTTWVGARGFMSACGAAAAGAPPAKGASRESADCFFKLFAAMREPVRDAAE